MLSLQTVTASIMALAGAGAILLLTLLRMVNVDDHSFDVLNRWTHDCVRWRDGEKKWAMSWWTTQDNPVCVVRALSLQPHYQALGRSVLAEEWSKRDASAAGQVRLVGGSVDGAHCDVFRAVAMLMVSVAGAC